MLDGNGEPIMHSVYKVYRDEREAILAYENREVSLHEPVKVRRRTLTLTALRRGQNGCNNCRTYNIQ